MKLIVSGQEKTEFLKRYPLLSHSPLQVSIEDEPCNMEASEEGTPSNGPRVSGNRIEDLRRRISSEIQRNCSLDLEPQGVVHTENKP
jgi:hypothetical protein